MLRVLSVFGTRPEAIKMAPVISELSRRAIEFDSRVCVTAQHREMLDQVLSVFEIEPEYDLDLMTENQTPAGMTASALSALDPVLTETSPNLVLVHGDTTTTMTAALAAFYRKIPVGHVEAGLRTHDRYFPFPEEMNRVLTDSLSTLLFAPTAGSKENLLREGAAPDSITVTGNTVIDALLDVASRAGPPATELPEGKRLVLVTAHRRESFGTPLENICRALLDVVESFPDVVVLYPVHMNPNVQRAARAILGGHDRIVLTEPLPYVEFVSLLKVSYLVVTDSGGLQEEAPALGKPVLVLRHETERPEAVGAGTVRVIGTEYDAVLGECSRLLSDASSYRSMAEAVNPYGDGEASGRIAAAILAHFEGAPFERPREFAPAGGAPC
ncbi:MAG: UDP-N-acetylglucosamine 2-epimerase (non-hydrolyzing) [Candidatus Eisenbacteria bacterium]|nr:UDP-N-acetylglucosamine 2-epimerase (non-hydrolyzing) [Candidatus Eisenbacteria bacterium]